MAMMFLGGAAALGAVPGDPFVAGFMILEFADMGMVPALLITPALLVLASSYLVQIGIWNIPGLGGDALSVPAMPAYTSVRPWDIVVAILVAIVGGFIAIAVRQGALIFEKYSSRKVMIALYAAAVIAPLAFIGAGIGYLIRVAVDAMLNKFALGLGDNPQEQVSTG